MIGAIADVHGNFEAMARAMARHPEAELWLCVGDIANRAGEYPQPAAPLYWIKGNNENFDRIAEFEAGTMSIPNLHYIRTGTAVQVGPLKVAGLGGTFAPTWFDAPAAKLPHTASDDKRRHFVREEAERCSRLAHVDILMTHEAPRPFIIAGDVRPRRDAGQPAITAVLAAMKPRLHLCGHHHRFLERQRDGVRSVCIDRVNRCYLLIDADTLEYEKIDQS